MSQSNHAGPIYVGYLPTPAPHRRLLRVLVPALMVMAVLGAALVGAAQRDPGPAVWHADATTFQGTLVLVPYPVLLPDREGDPPVYLVAENKLGAAGLEPLSGVRVGVRGRVLQRDSAFMLELPEGTRPTPVPGPTRTLPESTPAPVTLRGEIVDSKCCLGAMKPGEGKTHRACATLCIRGGVPPILVSAGDDGRPVYTLLTTADGGPANDLVLPHIAEPVRVRGRLTSPGGVRVLAVDAIE